MKTTLTIILLAVCLLDYGQAANQVFATDSTHGNENVYFTGTKESTIYQGVAGFVFTTSKDSATFYLQGCYNTCATCWYNVDTLGVSGAGAVNRELYQTPPRYKYYRLWADGNTSDTCIVSNCRYYLKY